MAKGKKKDQEVQDPGAPAPETKIQKATADPTDRIAELEAEVADLRERLLRARADYDNLQRRVARDAALERERQKARVLEDFLPVFEYSRMAQAEAEKHPGPLAQGVQMVVRAFERLLANHGVTPFGAVGDAFDPDRHEAVDEEASEQDPGTVLRVVSPGYLLDGKVLRYAKVVVASAVAVANDEEE